MSSRRRRQLTPENMASSTNRRAADILKTLDARRLNKPLSQNAYLDMDGNAEDQNDNAEWSEETNGFLRVPQRSSYSSLSGCPSIDISRETDSINPMPNVTWHSRRQTLENAEVIAGEQRSNRSRRRSQETVDSKARGFSRVLVAQNLAKSCVGFKEGNNQLLGSEKTKQNKKEGKEEDDRSIQQPDEEISQVAWDKDGAEMLSRDYVKGLNQRLFFGGSTNVNEHKRLIREIQYLKSQRHQQLRKDDHVIAQQRQKIMKDKEDFQKAINDAQKSKSKKREKKTVALPAMPRFFHPDYTHRKTQVAVSELAYLARRTHASAGVSKSHLGVVIAETIREMPAKLYQLGILDEKEGNAAELLLEIRDALDTLGQRRSIASVGTGASKISMDTEMQEMMKANRRREIVEAILETTRAEIERGKDTTKFSMDILKRTSNQVASEEESTQTRKILEFHSKLLQSHPFVSQAILMGGVIPSNLGGLGGRDFGREEKHQKQKKKKSSDTQSSFDLLQQEETKKGYCTVLNLLRAVNLFETKSVRDRISKWNQQMAKEKLDLENAAKRKKYKPPQNIYKLQGI